MVDLNLDSMNTKKGWIFHLCVDLRDILNVHGKNVSKIQIKTTTVQEGKY